MVVTTLLALIAGLAVVSTGMGETVCVTDDWRSLLIVGSEGWPPRPSPSRGQRC